ncbi:PEP-CTERM sorting domain-containing protein [Mucisphaera calidilacus]|uniref:Ice-binding protein C-terminal domain-containing protein n=1 Tax=Mucisphaera calidilacus TaxID=2527982 RepID=A0A518BVC9_9BACT|nr:PEP-CTERM sorting domain-containing protein [Mucisphaera calidilacus]QDU70940.1 hypothetical protein Pan265_07840 [Mucisphaera calidilacus]
MIRTTASLMTLALTVPALAAPTVDGTVDAAYGPALSVQTVQTQFGDATDPAGLGGGGELDAAYAKAVNGRLYVTITGNVEPNFNKLNIFIDSKAGGENVLSSTPVYDFNGNGSNYGGLTFDAGFEADFHMFGRWGGGAFEVDFVDRQGGVNAAVPVSFGAASAGTGTGVQSGVVSAGGNPIAWDIPFGFNNTNTAGVGPGDQAADQVAAAAVTTGFEFSIGLNDLGNPVAGDTVKIHVAYGNGDHNYHSNQILGGLPAPQGNLGGDGGGGFTGTLSGIDFNQFAGNQYFEVVVPEPASLALLGLGGLLAIRRSA